MRDECRLMLCLPAVVALSSVAYAQESGPAADPPTAAPDAPHATYPSTPLPNEPPSSPPPVKPPSSPSPAGEDNPTGMPPSVDNVQLSLEDLLNLKVTVASKEEETVSEAPSVVTVFTRDDIRRLGVRHVHQLLNFVPGFQANPDESDHSQSIDVRGRSTPTAEAVLVMIDGQRANDLYFGYPGLGHGMPAENIEQIEIIRGPGSALYGANAFLAVINIKTNRNHTDVSVGTGDMNRRYAVVNAARDYGELKLLSFVKLYADDGKSYPNIASANGTTTTAHDPVKELEATAGLEYRGLYFRTRYSGRAYEGLNCCSDYGRLNKYETSQTTAQIGYKNALGSQAELNTYVAYQRDDYLGIWPSRGAPTDSLAIRGFEWNAWSISPSTDFQWRLVSRPQFRATVFAGGTYSFNRLVNFSALGTVDPASGVNLGDLTEVDSAYFGDPYRVRTRTIAAGYAQAKIDLWSRLGITLGTRYDWYSDFGTQVNPRAAIVFTTPWRSTIKLSYGRAFRAPQIFEVGLSRPSGLQPETVQTVEASYVQQVVDVAQITVDVFRQNMDNLIIYASDQSTINDGHFATKGLELELRTRAIFGARMMGSYTHLIRQADDPGITPKDFGSAAIDYSWHRIEANANVTVHGAINQPLGDLYAGGLSTNVEKPAHALFNLRLQAELVKRVRAFASVNNVFDWRYQPAGLGATYVARGRTILTGLSMDL